MKRALMYSEVSCSNTNSPKSRVSQDLEIFNTCGLSHQYLFASGEPGKKKLEDHICLGKLVFHQITCCQLAAVYREYKTLDRHTLMG